ncbi:MAG: (Fe-S)-binding protein [Candidatus Jordarchaeales archaeon]|nr:(Fe-S)-binding protein [Candidatus Jordarchaeia archaeon]
MEELEKFKTQIAMCNICAWCRIKCPVYSVTKWESEGPRGRMILLRGIVYGLLEPTQKVIEKVYECTSCAMCNFNCDAGISPLEVMLGARRAFSRAGVAPPPPNKRMDMRIARDKNPYASPQEARFQWLDVTLPEKSDGVLFVGCVNAFRHQETVKKAVSMLKAAGYDFTLLKDEVCCGMHPYWDGQTELAKQLAEQNALLFDKTEASTVITPCAGCYSTFTKAYPELVGNFGFKVKHISEVIRDLAKEGVIELREGEAVKVTYHDPCHLGRHCNFYDPPRELIKLIPGVELVEMEKNRSEANCCGGGGGLFTLNPELAVRIAERRVKEAEATGSKYLITVCPLCRTNLDLASKRLDSQLRVCDLVDLVASRLRVTGEA